MLRYFITQYLETQSRSVRLILGCKEKNINQSVLTTYLEVTGDLEFDHDYILEMIEKFSIHPNQCNKCNDLSKVFMNPEYYYNNLYIKNSSWKLNKD